MYIDEHTRLFEEHRKNITDEEKLDIIEQYLKYKNLVYNVKINDKNQNDYWDIVSEFMRILRKNKIADLKYTINMKDIKSKYNEENINILSKKKLNFLEVITLLTLIIRSERFCYGVHKLCIEDNTFYNLICRFEEIKNELLNEKL